MIVGSLRKVLLLLMAPVAVGCGSAAGPGSTLGAQGHIHGTFTLTAGPTPTCMGQSPCPTGYFQVEKNATITVTRPDGTVAGTTTTTASGVFDVDVAAGMYTVSAPQQEEPGVYSATVTVHAGATVSVSLRITEP